MPGWTGGLCSARCARRSFRIPEHVLAGGGDVGIWYAHVVASWPDFCAAVFGADVHEGDVDDVGEGEGDRVGEVAVGVHWLSACSWTECGVAVGVVDDWFGAEGSI